MHPEVPGVACQQNHVGVYRTQDHGDSWQRIDEGLPHDFGFGLALHPRGPGACYVIPLEPADYMFRATGGALNVYRSDLRGNWRRLGKGLPQAHAYTSVLRQAMSSDSCDPCGVYFGTQGGQVFASRDEGAGWELAAGYLPPVYSVTAAVIE